MNLKANLVKFTAVAALSLSGIATLNTVKPQAIVQAASKVVSVNYVPGYGIAVWNSYQGGHTTGQYLSHGTSWKVIKTATDSQGQTWYDLGLNQWVMAKYTVSGSVSQAPTTSASTSAILNLARQEVGKAYVWGAAGSSSFDCSGLTSYVYAHAAGINIGRTTYSQINAGRAVSLGALKPGDLLFWGGNSPYHVGIYVGNNQYIAAQNPSQGVVLTSLSAYFYPSSAVRVLN